MHYTAPVCMQIVVSVCCDKMRKSVFCEGSVKEIIASVRDEKAHQKDADEQSYKAYPSYIAFHFSSPFAMLRSASSSFLEKLYLLLQK